MGEGSKSVSKILCEQLKEILGIFIMIAGIFALGCIIEINMSFEDRLYTNILKVVNLDVVAVKYAWGSLLSPLKLNAISNSLFGCEAITLYFDFVSTKHSL